MRTPIEIRDQLAAELGTNGLPYWRTLSDFISAKISRLEFEEIVRNYLKPSHLIALHNSFLVSIIASAGSTAPPSAIPLLKGKRTRRRLRAYQGDEAEATASRSAKLKQWAVASGKRERDRVRALELGEPVGDSHAKDEIARHRPIKRIPDVSDALKAPVRLATTTRGITLQHLHERLSLASAQHGMSPQVSRQAASLVNLALEAMLKRAIASAVAMTSSSRAIASINMSTPPSSSTLDAQSFATVLEISPSAAFPAPSAAVMQLGLGERHVDYAEERDRTSWTLGKSKVPPPRDDARWQMLSILRERSGVREVLDSL